MLLLVVKEYINNINLLIVQISLHKRRATVDTGEQWQVLVLMELLCYTKMNSWRRTLMNTQKQSLYLKFDLPQNC